MQKPKENPFNEELNALKKLFAKAKKHLLEADVLFDEFEQRFALLVERMDGSDLDPRYTMHSQKQPTAERRAFHSEVLLNRLAEHGAEHVEIRQDRSGKFLVSVDHGAAFHLQAKLARFLTAILQCSLGTGKERPWIALSEVLGQMAICESEKPRNQTVNQWVFRLRRELRLHGSNDHYLQRDDNLGVRFLLAENAKVEIHVPPPKLKDDRGELVSIFQ